MLTLPATSSSSRTLLETFKMKYTIYTLRLHLFYQVLTYLPYIPRYTSIPEQLHPYVEEARLLHQIPNVPSQLLLQKLVPGLQSWMELD